MGSGALGSAGVFQFTPLREGRPPQFKLFGMGELISIHAPPRGATEQVILSVMLWIFQFTPLREGRPAGRRPAP